MLDSEKLSHLEDTLYGVNLEISGLVASLYDLRQKDPFSGYLQLLYRYLRSAETSVDLARKQTISMFKEAQKPPEEDQRVAS